MNMDIWVAAPLNQLFMRGYTEIKFSKKQSS